MVKEEIKYHNPRPIQYTYRHSGHCGHQDICIGGHNIHGLQLYQVKPFLYRFSETILSSSIKFLKCFSDTPLGPSSPHDLNIFIFLCNPSFGCVHCSIATLHPALPLYCLYQATTLPIYHSTTSPLPIHISPTVTLPLYHALCHRNALNQIASSFCKGFFLAIIVFI